jgi:hypothetical protein
MRFELKLSCDKQCKGRYQLVQVQSNGKGGHGYPSGQSPRCAPAAPHHLPSTGVGVKSVLQDSHNFLEQKITAHITHPGRWLPGLRSVLACLVHIG